MSIVFYNILIQRYLCRNAEKIQSPHKTFSLLPEMLAPYQRQDMSTIIETAEFKAEHTYKQTQQHIQLKTDQSLEYSQINNINKLMEQTFIKINAIDELKSMMTRADYCNSQEPVSTIIKFIKTYSSQFDSTKQLNISAAEKLALDFFFHYQNTPYIKRDFLFGTPSHKVR